MIHPAALVAVWRPRAADFDDVNVGGLRHALEAVRTHGLQRLIYTSSFLARPPAGRAAALDGNDYQRTKAVAERVAAEAHASGAPIVRMYPGVIYGPGVLSEGNLVGRQIADHLAGRLPGLLGADRIWSFAWVESVAAAHVVALEHPAPAPTYAVGGPNEPQQRPFEILRDLRGTALPQRLPWWAGHAAALVDPARTALLGAQRQITHRTVAIFRHDWPLDSSAAERDLGYSYPPLAEGVAALLPASSHT
jgi:farnesol dehydrogenase